VYLSVPVRTFLQLWYRSVVYQVRVVLCVPVPVRWVCLTCLVADVHFLTRCGRVALVVFAARWRTESLSPETVCGLGGASWTVPVPP
jgi:hypothetical protein